MPLREQQENEQHVERYGQEFAVATRAIVWIAFFAFVTLGVIAYVNSSIVLVVTGAVGAIVTALSAPLYKHLGKIDDVRALIQHGQEQARARSENIARQNAELDAKLNAMMKASEGMPKTPQELAEFVDGRFEVGVSRIVEQTVAELKRQGQLPTEGLRAGQTGT